MVPLSKRSISKSNYTIMDTNIVKQDGYGKLNDERGLFSSIPKILAKPLIMPPI